VMKRESKWGLIPWKLKTLSAVWATPIGSYGNHHQKRGAMGVRGGETEEGSLGDKMGRSSSGKGQW